MYLKSAEVTTIETEKMFIQRIAFIKLSFLGVAVTSFMISFLSSNFSGSSCPCNSKSRLYSFKRDIVIPA